MGTERVHGPYKHSVNCWRVIAVGADGRRRVVSATSYERAKEIAETLRKRAGSSTVAEAVTDYLSQRHVRPTTAATERHRLVAFLRLTEFDRSLRSLSPGHAAELFEQRSQEVKPDTLAGELATVSRWAKWCVAEGRLSQNPFVGLVVTGERAAGKPQLRVSEARRFLSQCWQEGHVGTAAAMALLMGMRASEITNLTVRDVDDGGRLVWITRAKTKRGVRRVKVPGVLQSRLVALTQHREPQERLFGDVDRHWLYYHVPRICDLAGVPTVSPHGLRGTWATLASEEIDTELVARNLGHDPKVTRSNYAEPGAEQSRQSARVADLLAFRGTTEAISFPEAVRGISDARSVVPSPLNDSCARGDSNPHGVTH